MAICTGCKITCRKLCSKGGHGWCGYCEKATGSKTCNDCRAKQTQARKTSQSQATQSTAYQPPTTMRTIPVAQLPHQGMALSDMDVESRRDWLEAALAGLDEKIKSDSQYLRGRAQKGISRATDTLMSRHLQTLQAIYETLEAELDSYLVPAPLPATQVSHGHTGLLNPYPQNPPPVSSTGAGQPKP